MLQPLLVATAFSIPAGDFAERLLQFADQAQMSVLYEYDGSRERYTTKAIEGEMAPADAVAAMLDGLGFRIYVGSRSVTLRKIYERSPVSEPIYYAELPLQEVTISAKKRPTRLVPSPPGCVPLRWVAGMVLNHLGQLALDMGYMDGEMYCVSQPAFEVEADLP